MQVPYTMGQFDALKSSLDDHIQGVNRYGNRGRVSIDLSSGTLVCESKFSESRHFGVAGIVYNVVAGSVSLRLWHIEY